MNYTHIKSTYNKGQVAKKESVQQITQDKTSSKKTVYTVAGIAIFIALLIGGFVFFTTQANSLFNPVNIVSNISKQNLKETDGRTNILILGRDTREYGNIIDIKLTDVMMVASIGKTAGDVVLISVPRDLWVTSSKGYQEKINAMYKLGGVGEVEGLLDKILGIHIHYYAVVDFKIFTETIDILGGVDVNVERAFTDYTYPIEGKENAPENERYQTVHFDAGVQSMDGQTALKYVRSRHATDLAEGTDFARAKRQQNVIVAIKNKVLTSNTLLNPVKIANLYGTYAKNVESDIDLPTAQTFALMAQQNKIEKVKHIVLDNSDDPSSGGLLYSPEDKTLYRNAYVLIPKTGDYTQIHAFVQKYLFEQ